LGDSGLEAGPAPARGLVRLAVERATAGPAFEGIDEHRAGRGLEPIVRPATLVQYLVPETGRSVLHALHAVSTFTQEGQEPRAAGVTGGKVLQHVHQGHEVPAHGPAPDHG